MKKKLMIGFPIIFAGALLTAIFSFAYISNENLKKWRFDTILYTCNFNCNNFFRENGYGKIQF